MILGFCSPCYHGPAVPGLLPLLRPTALQPLCVFDTPAPPAVPPASEHETGVCAPASLTLRCICPAGVFGPKHGAKLLVKHVVSPGQLQRAVTAEGGNAPFHQLNGASRMKVGR